MKKIQPLLSIILIALLVAIYQVSLVGQKLNDFGINNDLVDRFPMGLKAQQKIEESKITLKAQYLNHMNDFVATTFIPATVIASTSLVNSNDSNTSINKKESTTQTPKDIPNVLINAVENKVNVSTDVVSLHVDTSNNNNNPSNITNPNPLNSSNVSTQPVIVASANISNSNSNASTDIATVINPEENIVSKELPLENTTIVVNKNCKEKCTILTIGDSMMGDIYFSLNRKLKNYHPDWKIINAHKVSSGLSKDTYYNWPEVAKKLVSELKPDYVIILIGMNDAQGITQGGKAYPFNTANWQALYKERTEQMLSIISQNSTPLWIEIPHVKADSFDSRLEVLRKIHKEIFHKHYLDLDPLIGTNKDAKFMNYRQNDGVHLNSVASDLIATHIYETELK